ncbi:hypothetical protein MHBO_005034, partial [Bonamia ostreae]
MLRILKTIYGLDEDLLEKWRDDHEKDYISLLHLFEDLKKEMNAHTDEKKVFTANIPNSLYKIATQNGASNQTIKEHTKTVNGIVSTDGECEFGIEHTFLEEYFRKIEQKVLVEIENADEDLKNVNC